MIVVVWAASVRRWTPVFLQASLLEVLAFYMTKGNLWGSWEWATSSVPCGWVPDTESTGSRTEGSSPSGFCSAVQPPGRSLSLCANYGPSPWPLPQPRFTASLRHSSTSHQVTRSPFKATPTKEVNNYGGAFVQAKLSFLPSVPRGETSSRVLDSSWSKWRLEGKANCYSILLFLTLCGILVVFFFSLFTICINYTA